MNKLLWAFGAGLVFGLGLILSGMANPLKVKAFLDLAGAWDPSLAFVMAGAIAVGWFAFRAAGRRTQSWSGAPIELPTNRTIDARLIAGGVLFGIGWGIAGFCPGPAIVALGSGMAEAAIFVAALLAGMLLHDRLLARG
jgi:uncharacterized membrane protein YedE/YeeE